jgi:hypothetical protein
MSTMAKTVTDDTARLTLHLLGEVGYLSHAPIGIERGEKEVEDSQSPVSPNAGCPRRS